MRLTIYAILLIQLNNFKNIKTAVILAGGKGTRLQGVVSEVPKPMAPINNRPFLEYLLDYWIQQGISKFILSVGYMKDSIMNHFGDSYKAASIEYAEEANPLGTGGGLLLGSKDIKETFLLINGDTFIEIDIKSMHKFHLSHQSDWTFSLFNSKQLDRYMGMDIDENGKIISLSSKEVNLNNWVNGGVYMINPAVLKKVKYQSGSYTSLEDNFLPSLFLTDSRVYGMQTKGKFIDIGFPEDYFRAQDMFLNF